MRDTAHLLVVDDEAFHLQALKDTLEQEGYRVTACADAQTALELLCVHSFDILLSDLHMPETDGITLTRHALQVDPDLVPVLMTGQATVSTAIEAMKAGALDYVLKPIRLALIRPVLRRAIEMRRLRLHNRQLQEDVARRTRQLETANQELDAFAARVAHDLRNPLHGILGFARLLLDRNGHQLDKQGLGHLEHLIAAGERADRIIKDLLAFARLGEMPLQQTAVNLNEVLRRARFMVQPLAQGRQVEWKIAVLPKVRGDASLLEQVFVNLLSNALKYTATRDRAVIEIGHCQETEDMHRIWVHDNGVGFDPGSAAGLFSPFRRLHSASVFEGNGIGLANVRRIVERHGGTVAAHGEVDRGASFSVVLPA
jgi:signal transduction histidine kinase